MIIPAAAQHARRDCSMRKKEKTMPDPLMETGTKVTPQNEQADPKQVPNSAGGFTFKVSGAERLHRFLTLGVEGGTYYVSERALAKENAQVVTGWARERS